MELNLAHDVIRINETVFNGSVEQSIEQDYALPDYYPGIFKVLKSIITPSVYNCRISGQKLVVDGIVIVKIIYQSEEDSKIHSIVQKYPFSKTVETKDEMESPIISYSSSGDYVNCRVVNPKRIDIRGAVTVHITVADQRDAEVLSNAEGAGVQVYRGTSGNINNHLCANKQFTAEDRFDVNPQIDEIIHFHTSTVLTECKIITNKLVVKGELLFHMLYRSDSSEDSAMETFTQKIPISQILDMPGVDEDFLSFVVFNNTDTELKHETDADGTTVDVSFNITAIANAYMQKEISYVMDAFSTAFESNAETKELTCKSMLMPIDTTMTSKQQIELSNIKNIMDFWSDVGNVSAVFIEGNLRFSAELSVDIMVMDNESDMAMLNKAIPIEFDLPLNEPCDNPSVDASAKVVNATFELNGDMLNFEVEFKLSGIAFCDRHMRVINELNIDDTTPKDNTSQSALTIYYADSGEHLWDISKKYNTSMDAVMSENSLDSPLVENRIMLLIPIVE